MWTPISTAPIFNLGNILIETFTVFIGDSSHVFWEKNPNGNAKKWSINDKSHSTALHAGIRPSTISMQFSAISLPRLFLQTFQTSSKLLFLYNFSLYWSLGLRIVAVNPLLLLLLLFFSFPFSFSENSFLLMASHILENFCLKQANPSPSLSIDEHDMQWNRFLTYPLKQYAPHSSNLVLFLIGVAILFILYSASAIHINIGLESHRRRAAEALRFE